MRLLRGATSPRCGMLYLLLLLRASGRLSGRNGSWRGASFAISRSDAPLRIIFLAWIRAASEISPTGSRRLASLSTFLGSREASSRSCASRFSKRSIFFGSPDGLASGVAPCCFSRLAASMRFWYSDANCFLNLESALASRLDCLFITLEMYPCGSTVPLSLGDCSGVLCATSISYYFSVLLGA